MEEQKTESIDYLKEIYNINKKRLFWTRVSVALVAVLTLTIVVVSLIVVPEVISTLDSAQIAMTEANEAITQAETIMDDMTVTIDSMEKALDSITKLVDDSSESLVKAFDNINSIDFEGLNDAITDLGNVVEPLSKFFSAFR